MNLYRMPRYVPPLSAILQNLQSPTAAAVGNALATSERTVRRWIAADEAPRPAALALFWCSSWGYSMVESDALQSIALARGLAGALQAENDALKHELARVVRAADFGCANDYAAEVSPPGRAPVLRFGPTSSGA